MSRMRMLSAPLLLLGALGCGNDLRVYPVSGRIVLADGDISRIGEAFIILESETEPKFRGDARLQPDGRFEVQMLHHGRVLHGIPAGKYRAKIQFEDTGASRAQLPVKRQVTDFATSGLSINVPAENDIVFTVTRK